MTEPRWCNLPHEPGYPLHARVIGQVIVVGEFEILVELEDIGDGRGAHITLGVISEQGPAGHAHVDLDPRRARKIALALNDAADVLDGGESR